MPGMALAPSASNRACSTASNTARAFLPCGWYLAWTLSLWFETRSAKLSDRPRTMAMSAALSSLPICGSFALLPVIEGASLPKATDSSGSSAMVFIAMVRTRLNSFAGESFSLATAHSPIVFAPRERGEEGTRCGSNGEMRGTRTLEMGEPGCPSPPPSCAWVPFLSPLARGEDNEVTRAHFQAIAMWAEDSGSSSPKQRW